MTNPPQAGAPLSRRESRALLWAAYGLTNRQIAKRMQVTETSATTFIGRAMVKLRARNRTHAVALGLVRGDLKLPADMAEVR